MITVAGIVTLCGMLLSSSLIAITSLTIAIGQPESPSPRPVLLIHGYASTASVWNEWKAMLGNEGINSSAITFDEDDRCGDSQSHARELEGIVEKFKRENGADKINIVAHSKGGLDARAYLANNLSNDDVANLIMVGTPNRGSPLALGSLAIPPMMFPFLKEFICWPAVFDLLPGSPATNALENENTNYYTIAGDWTPYYNTFFPFYDPNCSPPYWLPLERWATTDFFINGKDDGIVPIGSAAPSKFTNIGFTNNCHTNLFGEEEYGKARGVLLGVD
jgi:triacylglycerol lipase